MNIDRILFGLFLLVLAGCHHTPEKLEPKINYVVQDTYLKQLPSPFPPLTHEEKTTSWGTEYQIGLAFAQQLDLYQAITSFKRSLILIPDSLKERKMELNYEILLCYYLGKKYEDVIATFENSDLKYIDNSFPACHDLLIILYDSYQLTGETNKAEDILGVIQLYYPNEVEKLRLSEALKQADFFTINSYSKENPDLQNLLDRYNGAKKSITTAKTLNALLPGAGYFYVGQPQTAMTALLINTLFIAATYHFFHKGHTAAGVIFAGFEAGWYFGGIYGAGEEAKFYNEQVYAKEASPFMNQRGYFPVFSLKYAF